MVQGLQIDQALNFQRRFGRFQRVVWWLLTVIPVAAIAGLFGDGTVQRGHGGLRARWGNGDL